MLFDNIILINQVHTIKSNYLQTKYNKCEGCLAWLLTPSYIDVCSALLLTGIGVIQFKLTKICT